MNYALVSLISLLLGGLIGHRLAIGRDRRREYNEAARPIRDWTIRERTDGPSALASRRPPETEIAEFESYLWPWQRRGFRTVLDRDDVLRREADCQTSTFGEVRYMDDSARRILSNLDQIWRYVPKR